MVARRFTNNNPKTHGAMHRQSAKSNRKALSASEPKVDVGWPVETTKSEWSKALTYPQILTCAEKRSLAPSNKSDPESAVLLERQSRSSSEHRRELIRELEQSRILSSSLLLPSFGASSKRRWITSFARRDPRWQIRQFFAGVAQKDVTTMSMIKSSSSSTFTVWRPTSAIAIQRMIAGQAVGKGLEIKGKSAKTGILSGYVPYLQIHEERHKSKCMTLSRSGRTRIFFGSPATREHVLQCLRPLQEELLVALNDAQRIVQSTVLAGFVTGGSDSSGQASKAVGHMIIPKVSSSSAKKVAARFRNLSSSALRNDRSLALKRLSLDMDDTSIHLVDEYASQNCYGIELPDRLLWHAFVVDKDISRSPENADMYTGRPSEPAFQDMNSIAIQKTNTNGTDKLPRNVAAPRVVLWQTFGGKELTNLNPMDARGLIMAYEENGRVLPVVSDFDCFTMGTRGVSYTTPLPDDQVELLKWCVSNTENVLDRQSSDRSATPSSCSWTSRWLDVLKKSAKEGFHPKVPRFGFGDAKSYSILEGAVSYLKSNGAVRHGAECFNYYFPQDLDDEFLIVSDTLPGKGCWKYVNAAGLQEFLLKKIDDGYTFPLNPKWILCDEGWKEIFDRLQASDSKIVQDSLDTWFPRRTGIRDTFDRIRVRHPTGFEVREGHNDKMDGTAAMDLATLQLGKYIASHRARTKIRSALVFRLLLQEVRTSRASS